jgi:hypothetical protein
VRETIGEGREKGRGGVSGGSAAAREDADAGGSQPAPGTPKMGFFRRFFRYPYSRILIFFMA